MNASIVTRCRYMAVGWGTVGLVYTLGGLYAVRTPVVEVHATVIDAWLTFDPSALWLYLSFFLLVPCAYLFCKPARLTWLCRSMVWSALIAGCFFVAMPTTIDYPPLSSGGAEEWLLARLARFDTSANCFPSLHGALTLLSVAALWRGASMRTLLSVLWGGAILVSVIQLRRHLFIDLSAGVLLGAACGFMAAFAVRPGRAALLRQEKY